MADARNSESNDTSVALMQGADVWQYAALLL
jgi:hypothetical protein